MSMLLIGSAAARTISGSIESTVWMIAASLNCLYASARSASAFASASPLVNVMPASALPSSLVCSASAWALTSTTLACASPLVTEIAASAPPASLTRSASAWAWAIRAPFSPSARRMTASASASAGRTVLVSSSFCLRAASSSASSVCLRTTSCWRLGLGQRARLRGARLRRPASASRSRLGAARRPAPR